MLCAPLLAALPGIRHAFFTRRGGVSRGLYDSLNVGVGSRDDPQAVRRNRALAAEALGRPAEALVTAYQVHSARAVQVAAPWTDAPPQADALVGATPGVLLGALAADCAPVLIADASARIVAAVHAGWRGALDGVVEAAVDLMVAGGAERARLVAAVGPCIGPASYEVGLEFVARFVEADGDNAAFFRPAAAADKRLFDLPVFVLSRLAAAGVRAAEWIGRDTCAEDDDFFSNRRAVRRGEADYGRLLSVIGLDD
jgi:YfiH family protein